MAETRQPTCDHTCGSLPPGLRLCTILDVLGLCWLLQVLQADKSPCGISLPGDGDALAATAQFLVGAADIIDRGAGELSTVKVNPCTRFLSTVGCLPDVLSSDMQTWPAACPEKHACLK